MGVQKQPECLTGIWCNTLNYIEENIIYYPEIQNHVAPAEYYRETFDKKHYDWYMKKSKYLPYINNEKQHDLSEQYKERFSALNKVMLVGFQNDTTLYPLETAFFQERDHEGHLVDFNKTIIYQNDTIGLRTLFESNKIERKLILNK